MKTPVQYPIGTLPQWLTFKEAAAYCRVSPQTWRRWVADERVPRPVRVRQKLLWDRDRLYSFLSRLEA